MADDSMKRKISIALCTYNGAKYLSSQLESYLAQTCPPGEVVVCDDCSQDETVSTLSGFAERAPFPMRVLVNEQNVGSTKNFEKAISSCSGDIIFLSDQDDVWAPNKVERVVGEFDNDREVGMVFSDAELVDESLRPLGGKLSDAIIEDNSTLAIKPILRRSGVIRQDDLLSTLLRTNVVAGATLAFRAKYKKAIIPIPAGIPGVIHDRWIALVISMTAKGVFLNEPLVKYRQHAQQQIGASPRRRARSAVKPARISVMESIVEAQEGFVRELIGVTSRTVAPEQVMNIVNAEIDYRQKCVRHFQLRKSLLSDKRTMRLWPVIKELLSGRYHRCSNGILSAAGDLVG
jgi:glycosyltransferase involved in cell wall biosynthesis